MENTTTSYTHSSNALTNAREQFRAKLLNTTTNLVADTRCQYITTSNGVDYYNDAAADTIEKTYATLNSITKKIVWILGPYSSMNDYSVFNQTVNKKQITIITFGDVDNVIIEFFKTENHTIITANNLIDATRYAKLYATQGQAVVFSPTTTYYPHYSSLQAMSNEYITTVLTN